MSKGIIYIFTNPAMPDWIKVGITKREDVNKRMKELSQPTGVPLPFEFHFAKEVNDCEKKESAIFDAYGSLGFKAGKKEFIKMDCLEQVERLIDSYDGELVNLEQKFDKETEEEIEEQIKRTEQRERFTFAVVNLNEGDEVKFTRDNSITAKIVDANKNIVNFRGNEMNFREATFIALKELGYNWNVVQPAGQWTFGEEKNLHEFRQKLEKRNEA